MTYLEDNFSELFPRYTDDELIRDVENYQKGTGKLFKVLKHFFEEEMYKCHGGRGSNTPMEVLSDDTKMKEILSLIEGKPKFYKGNEVSNVKSFFRNAGRMAQKVANFPIKQVTEIYEKYTTIGDTIYDPSCGFGSRMSACMLSGRHYIGTDPNPTLCNKLKDCAKWYVDKLNTTGNCVIFQQGSEVFNEQLVDTVDFAFTSPPYYDLERYGPDSGQSIIKFPEYGQWLNGFVGPTVENTKRYLKDDGLLAINTKNLTSGKKYPLLDDWYSIMRMSGLEHVETFSIKQNSKRDYKGLHHTGVDSDFGESEQVMVFRV